MSWLTSNATENDIMKICMGFRISMMGMFSWVHSPKRHRLPCPSRDVICRKYFRLIIVCFF
ncbi:hypothetical protein Hanom_Chr10g00902551 [Helianthus anomalus]